MRFCSVIVAAALAAGVAGCSGSATPAAPAPLQVSGNEKLVVLKLPGMT